MMMRAACVLVALAALASLATATTGVDVSSRVSKGTWECIRKCDGIAARTNLGLGRPT